MPTEQESDATLKRSFGTGLTTATSASTPIPLTPTFPNEDGYTAIAFSNRFDLADKDRGLHCGEYRIVFAKNSGFTQNAETMIEIL